MAPIKQINLLEVGNALSQDQKSIAKGETLNEAPAIANPTAPAPAAASPTDPAAAGQPPPMSADSVYYIKNDSTQFKVLPFEISLLIEQNHIQDLLVELENSPMAIQVMEFEMSKPMNRVIKPVKGQSMGDMREYGGVQSASAGPIEVYGGRRFAMPMPGGAGGGTSLRGTMTRTEKQKMVEAAIKKQSSVTIHDPYFNIVEMTVYGQARFYNPPPPEPPAAPSVAETAPTPAPAAAEGTPPATEAAPKAEGEAPKTETPKTEAEAPKAEAEAPKTETPKEAAPPAAPGGEAPKRS
jgi:hypothetical protein